MPLGVVSDDEFLQELNKDSSIKGEIINQPTRGREVGDKNVPEVLRNVIAQNAIEEGNKETKELAREFSVSDSSISAYKNGATSTASYHQPNQSLKAKTDDVRDKISSLAKGKLIKAMKSITNDKMEAAKALDLSTVARNLSAVIKNIEPEAPKQAITSGPTFVVYNPPQKKEESYDVIVLKE